MLIVKNELEINLSRKNIKWIWVKTNCTWKNEYGCQIQVLFSRQISFKLTKSANKIKCSDFAIIQRDTVVEHANSIELKAAEQGLASELSDTCEEQSTKVADVSNYK